MGSGSIFENILKINEYCTNKLMTKIDLTKADMLGEESQKKPLVKKSQKTQAQSQAMTLIEQL